MKIVIVSGFYSTGMGYSENCLPKTLAILGHDVHVITSCLNVYGNLPDYDNTYKPFLGNADQGTSIFRTDGYTVHRLPSTFIFGYVYIKGMYKKLKQLLPDVVQSTEIASVNTFKLATIKPLLGFKLFCETHQHLSVIKPYLKNNEPRFLVERFVYKITRTLPSYIASLFIEKCYAIAPDCAMVANLYYGVPSAKIKLQSLGTDTELFRPVTSETEKAGRRALRKKFGFEDNDIVCIYTGRFSEDKNPLLLANAIDEISKSEKPIFHGIFIGEGVQREKMKDKSKVYILPFMKHTDLVSYYNMADIAVWPRQESMSMLDAAASGLPLVVTDKIGDKNRVTGNGKTYRENDVKDLKRILLGLSDKKNREELGLKGREKMVSLYSWINIAKEIESDYREALKKETVESKNN